MSSVPFPSCLKLAPADVELMLAAKTHIGSRNSDPSMERYIHKRRSDGVHIINLAKTWEKIVLAARIIVAIENPKDVVVIAARTQAQRAILKFAKYTGAQSVAGRFTPGTFTNQIQDNFLEPRVIVVSDPKADHQAITESAYVNVPTIAFCDTNAPLANVDVAIPCNTRNKESIGLMWWLLCREVLYMKEAITRGTPWDVMVDLFIHRDEKDQEADHKQEEEQLPPHEQHQWNVGEEWSAVEDQWTPNANWDTGAQETWDPRNQ